MGKTILDLFKNQKYSFSEGEIFETAQKHFDIKNSKDIKIEPKNPLLKPSFSIINKLREEANSKSETFLEQETVGLRPLRLASAPILYGSDIIRLTTLSTNDVEQMKQFTLGEETNGSSGLVNQTISKITRGKLKSISDVTNKVNNLLGIPKDLYPTSYAEELYLNKDGIKFKESTTTIRDRMIRLGEIKNNAKGTLLGKILKETGGGTTQQIAKRGLGIAINQAKNKGREFLLGSRNNVSLNPVDFDRTVMPDSWEEPDQRNQSRTYSKKLKKFINETNEGFNNKGLFSVETSNKVSLNDVSPVYKFPKTTTQQIKLDTSDVGTKGNYFISDETVNEIKITDKKFGKSENAFEFSDGGLNGGYIKLGEKTIKNYEKTYFTINKKYTKLTEDTNALNGKLFESSDYNTSAKFKNDEVEIGFDAKREPIKIDVKNLRPLLLKNKNNKEEDIKNRYSKGLNSIGNDDNLEKTIYGDTELLNDTLEKRRGFATGYDEMNQWGRFSNTELVKEGEKYQELDFIPLRFQRMNDKSGIYLRSTISNFTETFTPNWDESRMLGSPFKFYNYTNIDRKLSFSLKVYALSELELIMMWRRLEYLAHLTYPFDYNSGIPEPTLFWFTLGSVYVNKPAILTSLTYTIADNENLWELGGNKKPKVKVGNYREKFDGVFWANEENGREGSKGKGGVGEKLKMDYSTEETIYNFKRSILRNGENEIYDKISKASNTVEELKNLERDIKVYFSSNYKTMDYYKLPKFINAQIEITFLESSNETNYNIYGYGKEINSGIK